MNARIKWKGLVKRKYVPISIKSKKLSYLKLKEPITEPEMVTEDEAPNSIMDLINANRENNESDAPDLFSGQNIHQLDDINDTKDEEIAEESETDQDLLEIPSFLRRQSK